MHTFPHIYFPSQVLKFIITKPPSLSRAPRDSLRAPQTSLYLDTYQSLWQCVSSVTLSAVISKCRGCQTVNCVYCGKQLLQRYQ